LVLLLVLVLLLLATITISSIIKVLSNSTRSSTKLGMSDTVSTILQYNYY